MTPGDKPSASSPQNQPLTATLPEIMNEVSGFLDYVNAIKDISTGLKGLTLKYMIDESQTETIALHDGVAFFVFNGGEPTAFRKPLLGMNKTRPRPARYLIVRVISRDSQREKAPYLQPFWVEIPPGSSLSDSVDENWERRREPLTKGAYSDLDHKAVNDRFNNTVFEAFAPVSQYERSVWLPSKKLPTPALVTVSWLKAETRRENWSNGQDREPLAWFAVDRTSKAIVGAAYSLAASLHPEFKSEVLQEANQFTISVPLPKALECWRRDSPQAFDAYFDGSPLDSETARNLQTSIGALVPPEYHKWLREYFDDFWQFLHKQADTSAMPINS